MASIRLLGACGGPATTPATGPPTSGPDLGQRHPLNGRIWDARVRAFISSSTLVERLARARLVLLGEKHDNPQHHRIQARVLAGLVARGRRPAVAWEMIPSTRQAALDAYLAGAAPDAAGLARAVQWRQSGWPAWALYAPIARAALKAKLPMIAAGIRRGGLFKLLHGGGGKADLPALPAGALADLKETIRQAHCGHAGASMVSMMVKAQRHRDHHMASHMRGHKEGVLLIAGNGHARRDRGVPFYLGAPAAAVASLGVLEVRRGTEAPAAYVHARPDRPFDYLWFTTRVDNEDPCEKFKKQLQHMRRQGAQP